VALGVDVSTAGFCLARRLVRRSLDEVGSICEDGYHLKAVAEGRLTKP